MSVLHVSQHLKHERNDTVERTRVRRDSARNSRSTSASTASDRALPHEKFRTRRHPFLVAAKNRTTVS